jgi:hypothetical protein
VNAAGTAAPTLAAPPATGKPAQRLSLGKRLLFTAVAASAILALLAAAGEIVCRVLTPKTGGTVMGEMTLHRYSDDPYLGFELRPGVRDHNAAGYRGREAPLAKPPGTWRVAVIGDSVAYGLGVTAEQTFSALLEGRLNAGGLSQFSATMAARRCPENGTVPFAHARDASRAEVLNFGVPAYSTFQEYTLLKRQVLAYAPDLVIMVFSSDDTETSPVVLPIDGQMCLFRNQFEGFSPLNNRLHWGLVRHSYLYRFLYQRAALAFASGGRFGDVDYQPDVAWRNVLRCAELCRTQGIQFLLVISPLLKPHYHPTDPCDPALAKAGELLLEPEEVERIEAGLDRIRQLAAESHLGVLDLGPLYDKHGAAMKCLPLDHEHLGVEGHRIVAEAIGERLKGMRP